MVGGPDNNMGNKALSALKNAVVDGKCPSLKTVVIDGLTQRYKASRTETHCGRDRKHH